MFFFFKQKTTYDMRISDWSSDVCSSDLGEVSGETLGVELARQRRRRRAGARILDRERQRQRKVAAGERGVDLDRIALPAGVVAGQRLAPRSEEHTSELQSLMRISYAGFCLKKKKRSTGHD